MIFLLVSIESLPAFIASHVIDKMCLPCKLVLPELPSQVTRRQAAGIAKAMQSGAGKELLCLLVCCCCLFKCYKFLQRLFNLLICDYIEEPHWSIFSIILACDLIYVGSVDVANSGSDSLLSQTVQQLQSLDLSAMNIVTITVSREGITLQENFNG